VADRDLTLEGVAFLQATPAHEALAWLDSQDAEKNHLALVQQLRQRFSLEESGWLLDQARLRPKAADKFAQPLRCLYLEEALQQASSLPLAHYHARQFMDYDTVADLGAGIGADTLAIAGIAAHVIAVEKEPVRAALLRHNLQACGIENVTVLEEDWTRLILPVQAAFIDPARRVEGRRVFSLHAMQPPLAAILSLQPQVPNLLVKAAPGVDHAEIPVDAEVEFVSLNGELKEALLRFGNLRPSRARCATLLPGDHQLSAPDQDDPPLPIGQARAYLYEPDPAVIRAQLVRPLGAQLQAAMLSADIAYLTADHAINTPFARRWRVLRQTTFHLKTLNHWLREIEAGEVVIKKRGSPIDPDTFARRLKTTPGGRKVTVFFTRCQDQPWMILGEEIR
jgi:hypothetical protein